MALLTNDDYIECLRKHIEAVKHFPKYTILRTPSPAQIRNYCVMLCEGNTLSKDDLEVFNTFFQSHAKDFVELSPIIRNVDIDKLKPIQNFLKGTTGSTKIPALIEILALMYDYELRPYNKFRKSGVNIGKDDIDASQVISITAEENRKVVEEKIVDENKASVRSFMKFKKDSTRTREKKSKNKLLAIITGIVILFGGGTLVGGLLSNDQCMKWEGNRYVTYDCGKATINSFAGVSSEPIPYDKSILNNFKQISVDCDTEFFRKGKPRVWFVKTGEGTHDYFNSPGNGVHPISHKALKPMTQYHLNKYIYPTCP